MSRDMDEVDVLLIGAGPSNIALAVAMEELGRPPGAGKVVMLEAGACISWHPGMLFPQAQSQVSFLKDLATLRNPTSAFTFLNFLHKTGRLDDFVNLQTFFPYRREISAYLRWCVEQLQAVEVRYSSAVSAIEPLVDDRGRVQRWRAVCLDGREVMARRVVYGAGRQAHVPEPFCGLGSSRVLHASKFLEQLGRLEAEQVRSIAVVGGAQSSAEVYEECIRRFPAARVQLLMRSVGLVPYGGSKFTNALYSNDFVDSFYDAPEETRSQVLAAMRDSNYAGATPSTLESLFRFHYLQRMDGQDRAQIHTQCSIQLAQVHGDRIAMQWTSGHDGEPCTDSFDLVVLGTGYKNELPALLGTALLSLGIDELGVTRNYRASVPCAPGTSLHVLGVNEATHGISDTLLSVVGFRAKRVLDDMRAEPRPPARLAAAAMPNQTPVHSAAPAAVTT
ncbi:MAG: L-ornithine N(5)-monooxygenase PvdA [Rhizobacter sp.]